MPRTTKEAANDDGCDDFMVMVITLTMITASKASQVGKQAKCR